MGASLSFSHSTAEARRPLAHREPVPVPRASALSLYSETTFIDSSGLKEFVEARSRAKDNGHRLLMSGASPAARRLFELTETRLSSMNQGVPDAQERGSGQHGGRADQAVE
jgi:STAS domain-containing protein